MGLIDPLNRKPVCVRFAADCVMTVGVATAAPTVTVTEALAVGGLVPDPEHLRVYVTAPVGVTVAVPLIGTCPLPAAQLPMHWAALVALHVSTTLCPVAIAVWLAIRDTVGVTAEVPWTEKEYWLDSVLFEFIICTVQTPGLLSVTMRSNEDEVMFCTVTPLRLDVAPFGDATTAESPEPKLPPNTRSV